MTRHYSNNAPQTTLSAPVTAAATAISVSSVTGLPAPDFVLALDYNAGPQELVLVTAVNALTLTVQRGYDNTAAVAHETGAAVLHVHSAAEFADSRTHEAATSNVHGVTGTFVDTTSAQALINKDLTDPSNTFPATLVTTTGTQTLSNKTLDGTNTINGLTASKFVTTDSTGKAVATRALPAGEVVGTSDTQTLTNKTFSGLLNKFGGFLSSRLIVSTYDGNLTSGPSITDWTDYSPQYFNFTPWSTPIPASYMQIGKMVTVRFFYAAAAGDTYGSGNFGVSLPVTPNRIYSFDGSNNFAIGSAIINPDGTRLSATVIVNTQGHAEFIMNSETSATPVTKTNPSGWGNLQVGAGYLSFTATYEAA